MINNRRKNPVAARVMPIGGQQLPPDFNQRAAHNGGQYDRRDWTEVFKNPQWTSRPVENIIQMSRLSSSSSNQRDQNND